MIQEYSDLIQFKIDPCLPLNLKKKIENLISPIKSSIVYDSEFCLSGVDKLTVYFISERVVQTLKVGTEFRIFISKISPIFFSQDQSRDNLPVDAVLEEEFDLKQIEFLISPSLSAFILSRKDFFSKLGLRNMRKFEAKTREIFNKNESIFSSSDFLLKYSQALVDLEKELIQADELNKLEKILKKFFKLNITKDEFIFISKSIGDFSATNNFLLLPEFRGEFVGLEMNWYEDDPIRLMKKLFFLNTIVHFFHSQNEIVDPFFDESLWEAILDSIPFPVALLSRDAEVLQHNNLFAKLGFAPLSCVKLQLREKIVINEIPYNIFRKDVNHLDQPKTLFVFFTESFFLKGDGNLTPSGQELGIITSSIAHELNNPIAGILAALSVLLLDHNINLEARQTLHEMKNGALRCKQLIETFLGFSKANPTSNMPSISSISTIDICYQQAQNLLRFRTVESGIRFNFNSIKYSDFRSEINPSLLTMTFYLILGELMTLYSHHLLVSNSNQIEKIIKGEIIESSQEIQIQLEDLNVSNLGLSKLILNLLSIENFTLQLSDYSLRFIYNP